MENAKIWRSGRYTVCKHQSRRFDFINGKWHEAKSYFSDIRAKRGTCSYRITPSVRSRFISRSLRLFDEAKNKVSTQILTYTSDFVPNPYEDLNRYLTNLRNHHDLNAYMSALELTKKGQWHFHLLVDMPFVPASEIKSAWNHARSSSTHSNNSVRDIRQVVGQAAVVKYCADYQSKRQSKAHDLKKFTNSTNLNGNEYVYIKLPFLNDLKDFHKKTEYDYHFEGQKALTNDLNALFNEKW